MQWCIDNNVSCHTKEHQGVTTAQVEQAAAEWSCHTKEHQGVTTSEVQGE